MLSIDLRILLLETKEVVDTAASHLQQDNLKEVNNVLKQIDRLCVKAYGKDFSTILDQQCGYFLEQYEKYSGPHKENAQKVKVLIEDMCEVCSSIQSGGGVYAINLLETGLHEGQR